MKNTGNKTKNLLKIGLLTFFVSVFFMGGVSYGANDLLRQIFDPAVQTNNIIDMGENVNTVGKNVFEGSNEFDFFDMDIDIDINYVETDERGYPLCSRKENGAEIIEVCRPECLVVNKTAREECTDEWVWKLAKIESFDFELGSSKHRPSVIVKVTKLLLTLVITLSVTMILYNGLIYIVQTGQGKEGKNLVKNIVYIVIGIVLSLFSVVIITIIQSVPETIDQEVKQEKNNKTDNNVLEENRGQRFEYHTGNGVQ